MKLVPTNAITDPKLSAMQINALRELGYDIADDYSLHLCSPNVSANEVAAQLARDTENFLFWKAEFSARELEAADFLRLEAGFGIGEPQPKTLYKIQNYNQERICKHCFSNAISVAPWRINKIPARMEKHAFTFRDADAFFISTSIWDQVFKHLHVDCRAVIHHKSSQEVPGLVQLIIENRVDMDLGHFDIHDVCQWCRVPRYQVYRTSAFFKPKISNFDIAITSQRFGGGGWMSFQPIIVSQKIYKRLKNLDVKNLHVTPCRM